MAFPKFFGSKYLAIGWTLLTITLLCLPGAVIAGAGLFTFKHIDKVAHVILFGGTVLFWGLYFLQRSDRWRDSMRWVSVVCLSTIFLGISLEYIQLYFIPNRDFDIWDIVADSAAAIFVFICFLVSRTQK